MNELNHYLSVKELSDWLKFSKSYIYELTRKKKIPFHKLGGKILFDTEKIKQWINECSIEPNK